MELKVRLRNSDRNIRSTWYRYSSISSRNKIESSCNSARLLPRRLYKIDKLPPTIFPLMGFLGLEQLLQNQNKKDIQKIVFKGLAFTGGLVLLILIFNNAFSYKGTSDAQMQDIVSKALQQDRQQLLINDSIRSLFFILS